MKTPDLMRSGGREDTHKNSSTLFLKQSLIKTSQTSASACVRSTLCFFYVNSGVRTDPFEPNFRLDCTDLTDTMPSPYTTSAAAFDGTSLSSLPRHVSQLERNKAALDHDEGMRARYLGTRGATPKEHVEPLEAILRPHVSIMEKRRQSINDGDKELTERYGKAAAPRRRSALHIELEEARAMLGGSEDHSARSVGSEKSAPVAEAEEDDLT